MIQVNLKTGSAQGAAFMGDIDLSKINFKLLVIAVLVYTFLPGLVKDQFVEKQAAIQKKIDGFRAQAVALNKELEKLAAIEAQMEKMKQQEEDFNARLKVVQKVLETKKNPMQILYFIAKNIPSDVWLLELKVNDGVLEFKGNALNYDSIGNFLAQLKDSIFFDKNVVLEDYATRDNAETKRRFEEFVIKATIARYE